MAVSLIAVLASGVLTLALVICFQYERSHSTRFFRNVRGKFDRTIEQAKLRIGRKYEQITGQTMRQSIHYVFHQLLTALLRTIHRLEASIISIVRFNKNRATRHTDAAPSAHFSAIADHKREVKLSDTQKQQRRDQALMGR